MRHLSLSLLLSIAPLSASADDALFEFPEIVLECTEMDCVGEAAGICMDVTEAGHSTFGMMDCLLKERDVWDKQLNIAYQSAREFAVGMDKEDLENFPEFAIRADQVLHAQRAWIAYRDANCDMAYGLWGAGSMRQIAGADCLMQMTAQRVFELRDYADIMR